jgi:hypothetical protein
MHRKHIICDQTSHSNCVRQSNNARAAPPPAYKDTVQADDQEDDRVNSKGVAAAVARAQSSQAQAAVSTVQDVASKHGGAGAYFASQAADEDDFDLRGAFSAAGKYPYFVFSLGVCYELVSRIVLNRLYS